MSVNDSGGLDLVNRQVILQLQAFKEPVSQIPALKGRSNSSDSSSRTLSFG